MQNTFTAVFRKVDGWWVAWIEELPGANTQGETLEEARENLRDAVKLLLETRRDLSRGELQSADLVETLTIAA